MTLTPNGPRGKSVRPAPHGPLRRHVEVERLPEVERGRHAFGVDVDENIQQLERSGGGHGHTLERRVRVVRDVCRVIPCRRQELS